MKSQQTRSVVTEEVADERTNTKNHVQFGEPIITFQYIDFKLAEMVTEINAAQMLNSYGYMKNCLLDKLVCHEPSEHKIQLALVISMHLLSQKR
jgi:alkylation response protein AidB-like acyl-CoA dehydrogenase